MRYCFIQIIKTSNTIQERFFERHSLRKCVYVIQVQLSFWYKIITLYRIYANYFYSSVSVIQKRNSWKV